MLPILDEILLSEETITKARDGDAESISIIGDLYFKKQHYENALTWYHISAYKKHAHSEQMVGYMYNHGLGLPVDYHRALEWYLKAYRKEDSTAGTNIGLLYHFGFGVEQDYKMAMKYYIKAADNEDCFAQNNIGLLYEYGHGVNKNLPLALKWYEKSAANGCKEAKIGIIRLEDKGYRVDKAQTDIALLESRLFKAKKELDVYENENKELRKELQQLMKDRETISMIFCVYKTEEKRFKKNQEQNKIEELQKAVGKMVFEYVESKEYK